MISAAPRRTYNRPRRGYPQVTHNRSLTFGDNFSDSKSRAPRLPIPALFTLSPAYGSDRDRMGDILSPVLEALRLSRLERAFTHRLKWSYGPPAKPINANVPALRNDGRRRPGRSIRLLRLPGWRNPERRRRSEISARRDQGFQAAGRAAPLAYLRPSNASLGEASGDA